MNRTNGAVDTAELSHDDAHAQLSDLIDGTLDPALAARVRGHLRGCATCAADYESLRQTVSLVNGLPNPTVPERLRRRLLAIPDGEQAAQR
jgi:anti-sigma factor RsiW